MLTFGERLKKARDRKGMRQTDVMLATGISEPSLSRYESNTTHPTPEKITRLIKLYDVSAEYIMGLTDQMGHAVCTDKDTDAAPDEDVCGKPAEKAIFMGSEYNISRVFSGTDKRLARELDFVPPVYSKDEALERDDLKEVSYIFSTWGMFHFTKDEITSVFPRLKAVFYAAGTVKGFASEFLEAGVDVFSAWGANGIPVAQFTVAEILLAMKGWFQRVHHGGGSTWTNHNGQGFYPGIMDETVGIIGAGMIGHEVICELSRYPIKVLVYDKFLPENKIEALGAEKVSLPELFERSLVISNHTANVPETVGMLDYSLFSKMRENAVFINTGRGAQVKHDDLITALREDSTRVALLDVTDPDEPPHEGSPLYTMENVFLTPHIAGSIGNEVRRMGEYMYNEYRAYSSGGDLKYRVTSDMLATMA
ncbi:MAG: helix-turn-helix domain-containing protein [Firmicutes bacterium]|nr:helix-turn-helix domain-containing protein [Bacillota bacterium]